MSKITVIHHSADYDGIFCREIARKFLPNAELIGWDFKDKPLPIPEGQIYILDLPVDGVFGKRFEGDKFSDREIESISDRIVWIDHHKSSIESHPATIPGYRIDGVAACRLAWQWFSEYEMHEPEAESHASIPGSRLPHKQHFVERVVNEPLAVRLAGEYDIWDKRDERAETFQYGLRTDSDSGEVIRRLLNDDKIVTVDKVLDMGYIAQLYQKQCDISIMHRSFIVEWEGLKFLALTTARCNSLTFASKDVPETGHDALMGFYYDGNKWNFSLYHAKHRTDLDLSLIASKYGGGGHKGACGFHATPIPFIAWTTHRA